jgi:cell division protein FtsL
MKRRRARKEKLAIELFPFLAVLICTLGVLIVLLVISVKSADVQANNDRQAQQDRFDKQSEKIQQLTGQLDDLETKIEVVSLNRPDGLEGLSKSREYRGHLEAEIRRLKEQVVSLDQALAQMESSDPVEIDVDKTKGEIELLNQKILLAEKELEKKRKEIQANAKVTYSIVPHAGNGGTFRRPIFIECRADSITIQPLGIELHSEDFVLPLGPGNPLDAGVLAIREYWQKHQVSASDGNPYPLIVIRPDGSEGYAISRRALISWEDEFGYELVDADKELDFGKVDPELKSVVEAAISEARVRQQKMLVARRNPQTGSVQKAGFRTGHGGYSRGSSRSSDQRPGLTVSGTGGGFVVNSGWEELHNQSDGLAGSPKGFGANRNRTNFDGSDADRLKSGTGSMNAGFENNGVGSAKGSPATTSRGNQGANAQTESSQASIGSNYLASTATAQATQGGNQSDNSQRGSSQLGSSQLGSSQLGSSQTGQSAPSDSNRPGESGNRAPGGQQDENCENCNSPQLMYQQLSVAKSRGRDWAVPNKSGSTAYVRPIRIVCTESELEVMSPLGVEKRIPIGDRVEAAIDPLVNEIWRQIESWGIPGERSYWKPELRISVMAGGENNFEKLRGLLFDSGVQVTESER